MGSEMCIRDSADPRRLVVAIRTPKIAINVRVWHALDSSYPKNDRVEWWNDTLAVAAHPGMAHSNIGSNLNSESYFDRIFEKGLKALSPYLVQSTLAGAVPTLRAATDPLATGGAYFGPSDRMQTQGPAVKVQAKKAAYDVHDGRALWEQSIELTGVDFSSLEQN